MVLEQIIKMVAEQFMIDENEISAYASNGVKTLYKLGVISGYEDGTFKPSGSATRAEVAYMVNSILNILK